MSSLCERTRLERLLGSTAALVALLAALCAMAPSLLDDDNGNADLAGALALAR